MQLQALASREIWRWTLPKVISRAHHTPWTSIFRRRFSAEQSTSESMKNVPQVRSFSSCSSKWASENDSEPFKRPRTVADLMAILRMAVESRKVQLLEIALDLIQKLIAHKHIQGPVFSISHRRETTGKAEKRRITDDDDELESSGGDSSLPQVIF